MNFSSGKTMEKGDAEGVSTASRPFRFAIAGFVKNEARYILEWLAFHHAIGVEHFVVFDNESTDDTREILNAYAGLVDIDVIDWPGLTNESPQIGAYNEFLRRYRHKLEFAAFLDADEFLVPCEGTVLHDFLDEIPELVSAIGFNQRVFGSAGEVYYKPDLF
jgi:glycosyltransferase involved in cell wall biosynthesis